MHDFKAFSVNKIVLFVFVQGVSKVIANHKEVHRLDLDVLVFISVKIWIAVNLNRLVVMFGTPYILGVSLNYSTNMCKTVHICDISISNLEISTF